MSTHGRSSSFGSGSGGWFSGTMEVISGMAPRPSTPQGLPQGKNRQRSLSAPNSPARNGSIPGINRLPSQDSLDRSIHNESGHGKSTAQIIRDLKHSNAALTAKQASQEAEFMNQLSEVTRSFEDQRVRMDTEIKNLKKQLARLEAYKAAADSKIREKDESLSTVKQESAYLRHSISEMKNQIYQLQTDLEEAQQNERREIPREVQTELDQLLSDNQEMARELAKMQAELRDSERARHEMERSIGYGKPPAAPSSPSESPGSYYQKYQETHSELEHHRKRLSATQSKMEGLEAEKESLEKAHARTVEELQERLVKQSEMFKRREQDLLLQIESLEFTDTEVTTDLRRELERRDDTIAGLQDELGQYAEKAAELSFQLAEARQAAASQETYRRDEAEDLRILHDAQEEEINKLRKQLEDIRRDVEMRDEELEESNAKLEMATASKPDGESRSIPDEESAKTQEELRDTKAKLDKAEEELSSLRQLNKTSAGASSQIQKQLEESKNQILSLQEELESSRSKHEKQVAEIQATLDQVTSEKDQVSQKLASLESEKNEALKKFEVTNTEFSKLRNHWEGKAGAAHEADSLKGEIEIHRQRAADAIENERNATLKVQGLNEELRKLRAELDDQRKAAAEAAKDLEEKIANESESKNEGESLSKQLESAEAKVAELQKLVKKHEASLHKSSKQLREAQIALVALDDEKRTMTNKHRELLQAVEKKKEEVERMSGEQLKAKETELAGLQERLVESEKVQSEELSKIKARLSEAEALENDEIRKLKEQISNFKTGDEKDTIEKGSQNLQSTSRAVPVSPEPNSVMSSRFDVATKQKLESTIQTLTDEVEALRTKLKDRDTTISALVRSSVALEAKIAALQNNGSGAQSIQTEERKVNEAEIMELRKNLAAMREREPTLFQEIETLRKDLRLARQESSRWKRALEETGSTGSDYRYQIAMLHKELDESVERLKERDQAIENLVNQSISQDAHVKDLKTRLSALMKEMEKLRLTDEAQLESEVDRLQQETEIFAGQIIEQDDEIQNQRRRLQQRDDQIHSMQEELAELKDQIESSAYASPESTAELERLRRDIASITTDVKARDEEIMHLQNKLEETKQMLAESDHEKMSSLQAELDELRDASEDNRIELRDLRKQLWEAKAAAGEANDLKVELAQAKYAFDEYKRTQSVIASEAEKKKIEKLRSDLRARDATIAELETSTRRVNQDLRARDATIAELETSTKRANQEQVAALEREIESLRSETSSKTQEFNRLQEEIQAKDAALRKAENIKLKLLGELTETKNALNQSSQTHSSIDAERLSLASERDELLKSKELLATEINELRVKIESLESNQQGQEDTQVQLEKAQEAREASEKSLVDAYEKRISALNSDKEASLDQLRKELAETRGQISEESDDRVQKLQTLQNENESLREQFEVELNAKNQQIYALEHTLHAQEQIVQSMKAEMDQLQSGMEHANEKRRGEVEDLQQELMQLEGRALKQEREITILKMQLEEGKLEHKAEVVRLKEALANMEKEGPLAKTMAALQNDDRMLEVRERLEQLKARNTALQEENLKLGGRLERQVIKIKSLEFEKTRAEDLEKDNASLRRQMQELGSILEGGARHKSSRQSSSSSKNPISSSREAPSPSTSSSLISQEKEKNTKGRKGIKMKGFFKRKGFSQDDVIQEEE